MAMLVCLVCPSSLYLQERLLGCLFMCMMVSAGVMLVLVSV